ncbi:serine/threonine protein kinase [Streptomyces resistomycificus]|uniref:non-specific serine/threonine protein kinase n=1 Tax=Streptomyces resistomycificus TaxID=67356 RepID=A0A0L8LAP8_9ACTN|nr:serine/threonine-protein kinase [Streptomyces resistomycificus]KOG35195.1 serine/threonine protein kinase [Streptomyces resistomycificus]KUN99943.1 serine/threonine protein kinase [Streptomyces resistomycificus]
MTMVKAHVSTHELVAGRYRLLEVLHRETNRICWYGEDIQVERPCLLTQIGLPADPEGDSARRATARVIRMSETMGLLCPGRVAPVVDAVVEADTLWTVTDCIDGIPLGELTARQGTFSYVRAARIGLELLDVLEAAHGEGITHGELSPGQVFVREGGAVVVTGFGLAGATLAPRVTAPSYASPEQARDERIGPAADLWALGAILYTMIEGRPPFRDRDRPETTLKGVDRLPLRTPVRAGPLAQTVQGLLRKNSRERLTRPVVREALARALDEDPDTAVSPASRPRLRGMYTAGPGWSRRALVAGTALSVVTVAVAVLAVTRQLPGTSTSASDAPPSPSPSASTVAPGGGTDRQTSPPPAASPTPTEPATSPAPTPPKTSPSATATPTGDGLPAGYRVFHSPEGFSVALPEGWKALRTTRMSDLAYRVILGAKDDPRTLAVTYSARVGPDPVAVWRDDVEPGLRTSGDYRRIGEIRATTYQGREAADMEWLADVGGTRVRTFGRGFLIGEGRSFSLRWTTPAADWNDSANREALDTFLKTFRRTSG